LQQESTQRTWSTRVGHLVRQAMSLFETNRAMAWRCLSDASSLLGTESEETGTFETPAPITLKPGGLSVWQARQALAFMDANLGSKISITEISALVKLSKSHFCRAFKLTLGTSPMAYVSIRRIERAKLLITSTSERLSDIALACGFADQSHLNRSFGRMVGMSPGLWRRSVSKPGYGSARMQFRA
jgi:AraC family transcriptional regulator